MATKHMMLSAIALVGIAAGLGACDQAPFRRPPPPAAALPLTDIATGPLPLAPPPDALPPAPRAKIARLREPRTHYGYLDRGYELSDTFLDAPPDYAFYYDEVEPWVWRTDDGFYLVGEPLYDGWRYYYYEPDAYYPFLVRDPFYSYGFDGGALVVVYDSGGRVLPPVYIDRQADIAGRYLVRAETLYRTAQTAPHRPVAISNWATQQPIIRADRTRLAQIQQAVPEWRDYHRTREAQDQAHWAGERQRRAAWAAKADEQLKGRGALRQGRQTAQQDRSGAPREGPAATGPLARPAIASDRAHNEPLSGPTRAAEQARIKRERQQAMRATRDTDRALAVEQSQRLAGQQRAALQSRIQQERQKEIRATQQAKRQDLVRSRAAGSAEQIAARAERRAVNQARERGALHRQHQAAIAQARRSQNAAAIAQARRAENRGQAQAAAQQMRFQRARAAEQNATPAAAKAPTPQAQKQQPADRGQPNSQDQDQKGKHKGPG